jgi:hypothetical protein
MEQNQELKTLGSQYGLTSGQQQNYEVKEHSAQELERAKQIIIASKQQKKDRIRNYANNKTTNVLKGKKIEELVESYLDNKNGVRQQLLNFEEYMRPKGFTSSELGISFEERKAEDRELNQILNELTMEKAGFLATSQNITKLMSKLGVDPKSITHKKMKELIVLDDWGTIAKWAVPMIVQHGPKIINWLWDKLVSKLEARSAPGHDAGLWVGDYSSNNVQIPNKVSIQPGINTRGSLYNDSAMGATGLKLDAVNVDALATKICPERFAYREPLTLPLKTGVVQGSTEIFLTTDANGNTAFNCNPNNLVYTAVATPQDYFALYNPTGFVPGTGLFVTAANLASPIASAAANIAQVRVTGFSLQVTPIQSLTNAQGSYQFGYFPLAPRIPNLNFFTQRALMTSQYYQSGNALSTYRGIKVADPEDTFQIMSTLTTEYEYFYVLITGAAPSTNVCKIDIYYTCEVIPTPDQAQLTVMDYPRPGVRTDDMTYILNYAFPAVQMLTFDDGYDFANRIRNTKPCYDDVLMTILSYATGIRPKMPKSITPSGHGDIEEFSFIGE